MNSRIKDRLQSNSFNNPDVQTANKNFTYLLALNQALMEVLNLTGDQQEKVAALADALYLQSLSDEKSKGE